jgi:hypothetical protein
MECDRCRNPMQRSPTLVPGHVTLFCRPCGRLRLEGDGQWLDGGPGVVDRLRARAEAIQAEAERQADEERVVREIMESDWDDPRWNRFT